jgi:hypothetical protein
MGGPRSFGALPLDPVKAHSKSRDPTWPAPVRPGRGSVARASRASHGRAPRDEVGADIVEHSCHFRSPVDLTTQG